MAAALDVRVVRREEPDLRAACSVIQPTSSVGIGRHPDLALDVLARLQRQLLQALLVATRTLRRPTRACASSSAPTTQPCSITPIIRRGNRSRTPSRISVATVCMGGIRNRHVVDGAEILLAAVEVLLGGQPVRRSSRAIEQLPAATDVEHDRQPGLLRDRPHGVEFDVTRRVTGRAARRHQQRLRARISIASAAIARARAKSASGT